MYGKVINSVIALVENLLVPLGEMLHERRGRTADSSLDGRVNPLHSLGSFVTKNAVAEGILFP